MLRFFKSIIYLTLMLCIYSCGTKVSNTKLPVSTKSAEADDLLQEAGVKPSMTRQMQNQDQKYFLILVSILFVHLNLKLLFNKYVKLCKKEAEILVRLERFTSKINTEKLSIIRI